MKCLCRNEKFENVESPEKHCIEYHVVDEENYFYKSLFSRDMVLCRRKCFRCEHFCASCREKKVHNFLSQYQHGSRLTEEDKHFKKMIFNANLQKYCINLLTTPVSTTSITLVKSLGILQRFRE